jgi:threonine aldolase
VIDLRSDWVTAPTEEMWEAMRSAEHDDLDRLEAKAAALLGKEAAVWTPTCSVANLAALLTLAAPEARVALQPDAHILTTEGMGIEHVAGLVPVGLADAHDAALVCLENTHTRSGGTVLTVDETAELASSAAAAHLDGARLPNAAASLGVSLAELAAPVDTVALSLNKGLGAPLGAVLAGRAQAIEEARVQLRRVGAGSVHKAYVFAAAGLVALDRLDAIAEDNRRARVLAERLGALESIAVVPPATNIVLVSLGGLDAGAALERLQDAGVLALSFASRVRLVTHSGVDDDAVDQAAAVVERVARAA